MRFPTRAAAVTLLLVLSAGSAFATTFTFEPERDVMILENDATRSGAIGDIRAGETNNALTRRSLLAFDVASQIPAGATVTSVRLELEVTATSGAAQADDIMAMHRVLADWGEGTSTHQGGSGAPATPGDATWLDRFFGAGQTWTTPGGDFVPTPSATQFAPVGSGDFAFESSAALVADVQAWLDTPSSNHGWILIGVEDRPSTTRVMTSREDGPDGPRLIVEIEDVAVPAWGRTTTTFAIVASLLALGLFVRRTA